MNYFTKKQSYIFLAVSFLFLIAGSILICFSHEFINFAYTLFSEKIFHRSFDLNKWLPTIESFFIIPIFLSITALALFFPKFENKLKVIILSVVFFIILFIVLYCTATRSDNHVNSDLASEFLLAKECVLEKTFWPRGWIYSTEIRLFNTQLVTAPVFLFTDSWTIAKVLTTFFSMAILFFAVYFVLNQIEIKTFWLKYLICIFSVIPFSGMAWYVGAWGTYYIPHIVFNLIYIGSFIKLINNNFKKHKKLFTGFFYLWAFLSGLSSIRYIIIFVFPLTLIMVIDKCLEKDSSCKINNFREFWLNTETVKYSFLGLMASGLGYAFNNILLQPLFDFTQWNTISFCTLGDIKLRDILHSVLGFFGYQDNIAVLTPNGILNILAYLVILCCLVFIISSLKSKIALSQRILLLFFISSFLFNTFVYLHTELIERYYYPVLLVIFPCIAVLLENEAISGLKRYALGTILSILVLSSTFSTVQNYFISDSNTKYYKVTEYIDDHYDFGYATFWNANVITYLTNGKVEVGNVECKKIDDSVTAEVAEHYGYRKWLTPKRYYSKNYNNQPIFLLLQNDEYELVKGQKAILNGKNVYSDEYYTLLEYPSHEAYKASF